MWQFQNPVKIYFANGSINYLDKALKGRKYAIVTYNNVFFDNLSQHISNSFDGCLAVLNQVRENPDVQDLGEICLAFRPYMDDVEVLIALGGGSVIDTTKALAVAKGYSERVVRVLEANGKVDSPLPIIAVPTTTGTGSEVTSWATIWDKKNNRKFSLNDPALYPEAAFCDPVLTQFLPIELTVQTSLDALSHAMESIWNKNSNPVSFVHAKQAIELILKVLPELPISSANLELREKMMLASLHAGLAFSNTKTSIAHNISYAVTLDKKVPHGIACSFTLPSVLASFNESQCAVAHNLRQIFGSDLIEAANELRVWIESLGVHTTPEEYGYTQEQWLALVNDALQGERGKNFVGGSEQLIQSFNQRA